MKHIFKLKEVHLLAIFILAYIGVEVTLGGMYMFCLVHIIIIC